MRTHFSRRTRRFVLGLLTAFAITLGIFGANNVDTSSKVATDPITNGSFYSI